MHSIPTAVAIVVAVSSMPSGLSHLIPRARKRAERSGETAYIVFEDGEYHVTDDEGLDTYWLGQRPCVSVQPDGDIELLD